MKMNMCRATARFDIGHLNDLNSFILNRLKLEDLVILDHPILFRARQQVCGWTQKSLHVNCHIEMPFGFDRLVIVSAKHHRV